MSDSTTRSTPLRDPNLDEKGVRVTAGCIVILDGPQVARVKAIDQGACICEPLYPKGSPQQPMWTHYASEMEVIATPEDPIDADDVQHALWGECEHLYRLMTEVCPSSDPVLRRFVEVLQPHRDEYVPPADQLSALKAQFFTQPAEWLETVLCGWKVRPAMPTIRELVTQARAGAPMRGLEVELGEAGIILAHGHQFSQTVRPVEIFIHEGAHRDQVLPALERVTAMLRELWDLAITDPEAASKQWAERQTAA